MIWVLWEGPGVMDNPSTIFILIVCRWVGVAGLVARHPLFLYIFLLYKTKCVFLEIWFWTEGVILMRPRFFPKYGRSWPNSIRQKIPNCAFINPAQPSKVNPTLTASFFFIQTRIQVLFTPLESGWWALWSEAKFIENLPLWVWAWFWAPDLSSPLKAFWAPDDHFQLSNMWGYSSLTFPTSIHFHFKGFAPFSPTRR